MHYDAETHHSESSFVGDDVSVPLPGLGCQVLPLCLQLPTPLSLLICHWLTVHGQGPVTLLDVSV